MGELTDGAVGAAFIVIEITALALSHPFSVCET
jgi:hypothetical protein